MAKRGQPKKLKTPAAMLTMFNKYVKHCESKPIKKMDFKGKDATKVYYEVPFPLTMSGFESYSFKNGGPVEMSHYFANADNGYVDFLPICAHIRREIRNMQIAGGMAGVYNTSITQRLNGLVEKTETKAKIESSVDLDLSKVSTEALKQLLDAAKNSDKETT
jgi:hypothetical protein